MKALVSVIVPLFQGRRFIGEAVECVRRQTYDSIELLVVDNGSTDGGPAIAAAAGAVVISSDVRGAGAARNAGIAASRGEILMFLDQDDLWMESKAERQVAALEQQPHAFSLVHERLELVDLDEPPAYLTHETFAADHPGWVPSCLAVRREVFERVGPFDEGFVHGSDLDWFARAKAIGVEAAIIGETLVRRRIHGANSLSTQAAASETIDAVRMMLARRRAAKPDRSGDA